MPDYLKDFELLVSEKIDQEKLDEALNLIVRFVQNILQDQRATAKVFGSSTLDGLCQKIGAKTLLAQNDFGQSQLEFDDQLIIYIATELYMTGGHTAVLEDFIKFQPDKKHLILMTDLFGTGETEAVKNRFDTDIVFAIGETYLDKLYWLQLQLTVHKPSQIFLFNHHQDAVAISSVQPTLTSQLIFYHHCDHNMSLGLYLSHAKHIDPHSFGYYNCRNKLGVKNNIYIPLVAEDLQPRSSNSDFVANKKLTTCSSGSANKFEQPYSYIYAEEVPKILAITDGYHIHIGSLSPQTLVTIQRKLGDLGINPDKFIHIPWVKSIWRAMSDHNVDLYISSFPIGGGRASIEVMGSGTPIIGCRNYHSRLLSVVDIIYPEAFFWDNPEELYNYLDSLTQVTLFNQANFSRKHYAQYHSPKIFVKCLEGLWLGEEILVPPPLKEYPLDELKAFLDDVTPYELRFQQTQSQLQHTQSELERSHQLIQAMEASKFWKLRNKWLNLKRKMGVNVDV